MGVTDERSTRQHAPKRRRQHRRRRDHDRPDPGPAATHAGRSADLLDIDRPGDPTCSRRVRDDALAIVARYPAGQARSALLPMLHLVQSEQGYVTPDGIAFCADVLGLTKAQVAAVATFYTMYKRKPTGEYLVSVCTNTLCGLLGGDEIYATLSERSASA